MGCFCSKPAPSGARAPPAKRPRRELPGLSDVLVHEPRVVPGSLQVGVCAAAWPANAYRAAWQGVQFDDERGLLFASSFVSLFGEAAAKFCHERAYKVFQEEYAGSARGGSSDGVSRALAATFARLDREFLAHDKIALEARASTGASGALLLLDFHSAKAYAANVGTVSALVVSAVGSFAAAQAEGALISADHTLRNELERRRMLKAGGSSEALLSHGPGGTAVRGVTHLTRAIGFGCLKSPDMADAYNAERQLSRKASLSGRQLLSAEATVVSYPLGREVRHLALLSEGACAATSRVEQALLLHFHEQFTREQAEARAIAAMDCVSLPTGTPAKLHHDGAALGWGGGSGGQHVSGAEALLLHAVAKAGDAAAAAAARGGDGSGGALLDVEALRRAPLSNVTSLAELAAAQRASPSIASRGARGGAAVRTPRGALHGDLSALVVTLTWPDSAGPVPRLRPFSAAAVAKAVSLETADVSRRWALMRMAAHFHVARRRALRRAWWRLVDDAMRDGRRRAAAVEQKLWRERNMTVRVSPSLKIKDLATGQEWRYSELLEDTGGAIGTPVGSIKALGATPPSRRFTTP